MNGYDQICCSAVCRSIAPRLQLQSVLQNRVAVACTDSPAATSRCASSPARISLDCLADKGRLAHSGTEHGTGQTLALHPSSLLLHTQHSRSSLTTPRLSAQQRRGSAPNHILRTMPASSVCAASPCSRSTVGSSGSLLCRRSLSIAASATRSSKLLALSSMQTGAMQRSQQRRGVTGVVARLSARRATDKQSVVADMCDSEASGVLPASMQPSSSVNCGE